MNSTEEKIVEIRAGLEAMRTIARDYGFFPIALISQVETELADLVRWRLRFEEERRIESNPV